MRLGAVALVALAATLAITPADAQSHKRHRVKSKSQLQSKLSTVRRQKEALRRQLRQTKKQAHEVKEAITQVDSRLDHIEGALQETNTRLTENRSEQKTLGERLVAANERLGQVKEQVRRRMRYLYLRPQGSEISVLIGSKSMSQLLSRKQISEAVIRRDRSMFDEYRNLQAEVAEKKRRQDELVADIRDLRQRQVQHQNELEESRQDKKELLDDLRGKQSELQKAISQFERDEAAIESEIAAFARRRPSSSLPAVTGRFLKPANGPITSGFGMRYHPILHITRMHKGLDIGARSGSAIYAAADGEVVTAHYSSSYGNFVMIAHGSGLTTVYAHASRLLVHAGEHVRRGQHIANVGSTGLAKGPHLHFEVYRNGHAVNPAGFL